MRRRLTPKNVVPITLVWTLLAMVGDYTTNVDVRFTLVYFFPIVLGAWFRGGVWGSCLAALATAGSLLTDHMTEVSLPLGIVLWNTAGVLVLMLVAVWTIDRLKRFVDAEERERHLAVEQLRHAGRLTIIGKLAAGVAHELGTPLNVIAGHAELLTMTEPSPARISASTQTILQQTTRMTVIIRQLLDFGRKQGGERVRVNLNTLATTATKMLETMASKAGCELEIVLAPSPVEVEANVREIEQVLTNLIINAVQAMPAGGKVQVRTALERTTESQGRSVFCGCLSVTDAGGGIAEADLARVFDPFFTTKEVGVGTGLGLSVSYGIVSDHGGHIDVQSKLGHGSTFTVRLPQSER